jgi:hypothetical protein
MRVFYGMICAGLLVAPAAMAQEWEAGALGGYAFTKNTTIRNPAGSVSAGFKNGPAFGFFAGSNEYRYLGGEASYLYRQADVKLGGGGSEVSFSGHTQFVDFRFLLHFAETNARVRPFVAIGGGVAVYSGTGAESATQPLNNFAALTHTRDVKPMLSAAAGLKYRFAPHAAVRFEFRDYVTPFPDKVIAPVPGASAGGWLHNLIPLVGIEGVF